MTEGFECSEERATAVVGARMGVSPFTAAEM
jgi:hypothetical protein